MKYIHKSDNNKDAVTYEFKTINSLLRRNDDDDDEEMKKKKRANREFFHQ